MALTLEVVQDHLTLLAVAKPSIDDCMWVKQKASDVFEFSGGDKNIENSSEDAEKRASLISMNAARSLLKALNAMTECAMSLAEPTISVQHVQATGFLLRTIRNLARDPDESINLVTTEGALPVIEQTLQAFRTCPEISRDCLGVLANCAAPSLNRVKVFQECSQSLLACLKANANDIRIVQNGCACLVNLSYDVTQLKEVGEVALPVLVEIGSSHAKDAYVAENVLSAFAALLIDADNSVRLTSSGQSTPGVELIANLMRLHSRNLVVNEQGLRSIYSLCQVQENKPLLIRCGCLPSIRSATTNCPFVSVAEWACKALRALSHSHPEMKLELYKAGATEWITEVVRSHGTSPVIAKAGLSALWSLANHVANKGPMVNKDQSGVVVVNAMRLNPDSIGVALTGSAALASLANDYTTKKKLVKDGCVTAIVHAMNAHPSNALVSEYSCACLWSLCMDRDVQKTIGADSVAGKTILDALTQHSRKRPVVVRALGALESLSYGQDAANMLVNCGAVAIVSSIVRVYLQNDCDIVERCCNVLTRIARFCEDPTVFEKYGVAETAIDIQRAHPSEEGCIRATERLLTALEGGRGDLSTT